MTKVQSQVFRRLSVVPGESFDVRMGGFLGGLLDAFAQYLSARPDLRVARALAAEPGHSTAVISEIRLAAANLLILLPDPDQRTIVEQDLQTVEDWIDLWLKQPSKAIRTDVPSVQHVLELARDLVVEPKADTSA